MIEALCMRRFSKPPPSSRLLRSKSEYDRPVYSEESSGAATHDLRCTCARLCHQAGGELEQIQFLLGHVSVQTTERYLGCKQRFRDAVNDHIGLEPDASS
jgi:integrase